MALDTGGNTIGNIGTLLSGTIQLNPKPNINILTYGTVSAGTIGTLVAAPGAGTAIYVCSYAIDLDSTALGTPDVCISFGTQTGGTAVIFRGGDTTPFGQTFIYPVNAGITATALTWLQLAGGGTVSINISYFTQ